MGDMYVAVVRSPPASIRGHSTPGFQAGQQCLPQLSHSGGESAGEPGHQGNSTAPDHTLLEPLPKLTRAGEHDAKLYRRGEQGLGQCPSGPRVVPIGPILLAIYLHA